MPSLELLSDPQQLRDFAAQVAVNVDNLRTEIVNVNDGIQTTDALKARIAEGCNIPFNFARLIDESQSYK